MKTTKTENGIQSGFNQAIEQFAQQYAKHAIESGFDDSGFYNQLIKDDIDCDSAFGQQMFNCFDIQYRKAGKRKMNPMRIKTKIVDSVIYPACELCAGTGKEQQNDEIAETCDGCDGSGIDDRNEHGCYGDDWIDENDNAESIKRNLIHAQRAE